MLTGGNFVASTRDVPNSQFMSGGTLTFSGTSNGTVTNEGSIRSLNGDVVLIGQSASNTGTISAPNGTAALAAGNQVVLQPENGPAGIYVAPDVTATGSASNAGTIKAAAAALASAGGNVYALAGNRGGVIQATGTKTVAGQVWLTAPNGTVEVSGTVTAINADGSGGEIVADGKTTTLDPTARLNASGTTGGSVLVGIEPGVTNESASTTISSGAQILATGAGSAGGHIETSGQSLTLGGATVDAGQGGSWVIDPVDLTVTPGAAGAIDTSLNDLTNVTLETTATGASGPGSQNPGPGDIYINSAITWSTNATLTLSAFHSVRLNADIIATSNGRLDIVTNNNMGGTSSGGALNIELNQASIQFTTLNRGVLNINGHDYQLIWTVAQLQKVGSTGYYALARTLDAGSYSGFTPIGGNTGFTGTFNGLGNVISDLDITSGQKYVGLFGQIVGGGPGAVVANLIMLGGSVVSQFRQNGGSVGQLAGYSSGTILNVEATGSVSDPAIYSDVGGLVGYNQGTISASYANGAVTGGASEQCRRAGRL